MTEKNEINWECLWYHCRYSIITGMQQTHQGHLASFQIPVDIDQNVEEYIENDNGKCLYYMIDNNINDGYKVNIAW